MDFRGTEAMRRNLADAERWLERLRYALER
jgi:hypothetical protein